MTKRNHDRFLAACLLMMAGLNFVFATRGSMAAAVFVPLFLALWVRQLIAIHHHYHVRHEPGFVRDPHNYFHFK